MSQQGKPQVSVIIPVMNERRTIAAVIRECRAIAPHTEVIVVANGCTDGSADVARQAGARVLEYPDPLGHDVGRSIGASAAQGDILLFTDADIVIGHRELRSMVQAVESGVDVALNRYLGPHRRRKVHQVILAKHALNTLISAPHLKGASMTTIPHAMSRHALHTIGAEQLAVPPKAHAVAVSRGLRVEAVRFIEVGKRNRRRARASKGDPLGKLIFGDHLEALAWLIEETDERAHREDVGRKRDVIR